jgi:excisionase family DNA binding protein
MATHAVAAVEPVYYSPLEVATILGISRSQVYKLCNSDDLDDVKIGKARRITVASVERYRHILQSQIHAIPARKKS